MVKQQAIITEQTEAIMVKQQAIIDEQAEVIKKLRYELEKLQRLLFGQKSERRAKEDDDQTSCGYKGRGSYVKKVSGESRLNGRRKLPEDLERMRIEHDVPAELQVCTNCQTALHRMGEVVSEQLDFIPAKLYVKQHVRYKYACRCCQSRVVTAQMPEQPIAKGLAGSGLLAALLIDKYEDALPLYRQEQRWKRMGYELNRSTLGDWVSQCAGRLSPIVDALKKLHLLASPKIHSDDTIVPVFEKDKTRKGRLWVYVGGTSTILPCVVYEYSPNRKQEVPLNFLTHYKRFFASGCLCRLRQMLRKPRDN